MAEVDTDFSNTELPLPFPAANHARWDWGTGSPTVMQFEAGAVQPVELYPHQGGGWLMNVSGPQSIHQSVEVMFEKGDASTYSGQTAVCGAVLRYQNSANYVALVVDLNSGGCEILQRIAGTTTVIANPSILLSSQSNGGSVKIEVIGSFVRGWFATSYRPCDDEPPLIEAQLLSVPDDNAPGGWGIMMQSTSTNARFAATHFQARELPNVFLPAPQVFFDNAHNYDFQSVTVAVDTFPTATTEKIEWESSPLDADDFSEVYRDVTTGSTFTSRVFWIRSGYTREFRSRAIAFNGVKGEWSKPLRYKAPGTKVIVSPIVYADDVFPNVVPDYVMEQTQTAVVDASNSGSNRERTIQSPGSPVPRRQFRLDFKYRLNTEMAKLQMFFADMKGQLSAFQWEHPTSGELLNMRFAQDNFGPTFDDQSVDGPIMSASLIIVEAKLGVNSTIIPELVLDASLI